MPGLEPWLDEESLLGGDKWKIAIKDAIRNSSYFVPLLSSKSVGKIGYVQTELKEALEVVLEFPQKKRYIIPARLEDIRVDEKLSELHIIDLFHNWQQGIQRILKSIGVEQQGPNDFWGLMTEGNVLMDSGKYNEALGYYNKALNIDPKNSYAWYNKGMALCADY